MLHHCGTTRYSAIAPASTGITSRKWMASEKNVPQTSRLSSKLVFFSSVELWVSTDPFCITTLEKNCQRKLPEIR